MEAELIADERVRTSVSVNLEDSEEYGRVQKPAYVNLEEEDEEEEEDKDDEEESEKWLKYYSSNHQILLVGEGDFSFSLCLAKSFGSASNIVASSLDSHDEVRKKYKKALSNLKDLRKLGACLLHGVDATKMKLYPDLKMRKFDRIIFNFPHAGFHGKESSLRLIKKHKNLVSGFFMSARSMLRPNGEIHVNHKIGGPFTCWNIPELGMQSFLRLIEHADFHQEDYPGYNNKRGDGPTCDNPFPLGKCGTFKFVYDHRTVAGKKHKACSTQQRSLISHYPSRGHIPEVTGVPLPFISFRNHYPLHNHIPDVGMHFRNGYLPFHGAGYFTGGTEIPKRTVSGSFHEMGSDFLRSSWAAPTNYGFPQIDRIRNMNMVPMPLSVGVRGRSEHSQLWGADYCSRSARLEHEYFVRYIPRRTWWEGEPYVRHEELYPRVF